MNALLTFEIAPAIRRLLPVARLGSALGAAFFAYRGFARYHESRANFDEALLWLGLGLVCLAAVNWEGPLPRVTFSRRGALVLIRRYWWELAALTAIVGFAAILRLQLFNELSGVVYGEEADNGRIAYQILHAGDRPLAYPLTRYVSAGGFLLFGENTTGLRLPFVFAGIATLVPFYLLARELVRAPAALFATTLLAASRLLFDPTDELEARMLVTVVFLYLFVRGARMRSPLLLLVAGVLAGILSYEWDAFKLAPLVAVAFVGLLAVRRLAWPLPRTPSTPLLRAAEMVRTHWRPALAFSGAATIAAIPLIVAQLRGDGIYLHDISRHRTGAFEATPGLFADDWPTRTKWAAELFLPFGPRTFPSSPISTGLPLVDVVTGVLLGLSVIYALFTFYKPYRALFLGYLVVGIAGAALIADPFRPWRFIPLLPISLMLVAFLVDDVASLARRLAPRISRYAVPALVVGAALYASASNADALLDTMVHDPELPRVYTGVRPERSYLLCDYLRSRGEDNFSYLLFNHQSAGAFASPSDSVQEQVETFGDVAWVCGGLRGIAVAAPEEAWPFQPSPDGPATLALMTEPGAVDKVAADLQRALPAHPRPDRIIVKSRVDYGPVALLGYEFSQDDMLAFQGLFARYERADGQLLDERIDGVAALRWTNGGAPAPPFTVRWRGLIYVEKPGQLALVATGDDPAEVRIDGQVSFSSLDAPAATSARDLLPGWHPIEAIVVKQTPGGAFSLRWVDDQGRVLRTVSPDDLFPLRSLNGWRHRRTLTSAGEPLDTPVTERFDFEPYLAVQWLVQVRAVVTDEPPPPDVNGVRVAREEWSTVWRVPQEREYTFSATVWTGTLTVTLDGAPVIDLPPHEGGERTAEAVVRVPTGVHRIEVTQVPGGGLWTGATLSISDPNEPWFVADVAPF